MPLGRPDDRVAVVSEAPRSRAASRGTAIAGTLASRMTWFGQLAAASPAGRAPSATPPASPTPAAPRFAACRSATSRAGRGRAAPSARSRSRARTRRPSPSPRARAFARARRRCRDPRADGIGHGVDGSACQRLLAVEHDAVERVPGDADDAAVDHRHRAQRAGRVAVEPPVELVRPRSRPRPTRRAAAAGSPRDAPARTRRARSRSLGGRAERGVEPPPRVRAGHRVLDPDQVAGAGEHELERPRRERLDVVAVELERIGLRARSRRRST